MEIIIKPHPRTFGYYSNINNFTTHKNRIKIFERNIDTSSLTTVIDVVITPGSSVVPHFLWQEKPVILMDDWAKKNDYSFTYDKFCYHWKDISKVIENVRIRKMNIINKSQNELEQFFQCGVRSNQYEAYLVKILNTIL